MYNFEKWFATSPLAAFARVFVSVVIGAAVADFTKVSQFDFSNWQTWLIAGIVAASPVLMRWLNPQDEAFGTK